VRLSSSIIFSLTAKLDRTYVPIKEAPRDFARFEVCRTPNSF
jgi:hypothetical protein